MGMRENVVVFNMEVVFLKPDSRDNQLAIDTAISWANMIVTEEDAPEERLIACG